jgi:hypothetical protein
MMEAAQSTYHNTTRRLNPEVLDLKHHRRENLKTSIEDLLPSTMFPPNQKSSLIIKFGRKERFMEVILKILHTFQEMAPSLAFFYKYMFHIGLPISSGYA